MTQAITPSQPSLIQVALWVLYRYRLWLAMWCALLAVVAIVAGRKLGKETWRVNAGLTYAQRPIHDGQRNVYEPPNHATLAELLRSSEYLDAAAARSEVPMPTALISTMLEVQLPPNTQLLQMYLNWSDQAGAVAFIDALMEIAIEKRTAVRNQSIKDAQKSNAEQVRAAERLVDQLEADVREHFPTPPGTTLAQEVAYTAERIHTTEERLREVDRLKASLQKKAEQVEEHFRPLIAKDDGTPVDSQAEIETQRKIDQLRQASMDNAQITSLESELATAKGKLGIDLDLLKQNAIARIEVEESQNRVRLLEKQLRQAKAARQQVDAFEKQLKGDPKNPIKKLSLVEQEYQLKKFDLTSTEGQLVEDRKHYVAQLDSLKALQQELNGQLKRSEPLQRQVDNARTQVQQLNSFAQNLAAQVQPDQRELSVEHEANAGTAPFATSFKKWTVAVFLIGFGGFVAGLVAWEMMKVYRGFEGLALRLGVPILARFGAMPLSDGPELAARLMETRRLALRLCQALPEPGSMVLLASAMRGTQVDHFAAELSRCLAHHEERILILDMRADDANPNPLQPAGLPGYEMPSPRSSTALLAVPTNTVSALSLTRPTQLRAVDYLPIGGPDQLAGVMAMTRLRQAIAELKQEYTLVFMIAPPLTGDIDTEILGAFAQGVVLVADENAPAGVMTLTITGLRSAQVPIIGAVVYPADEPVMPALVVS